MSPYAEQIDGEDQSNNQISSNINNNNILLNTSSNSLNNSNNLPVNSNIEDLEHYLATYSNDFPELVVGACWWAESLGKLNQNIPKENIKRFRKELIIGLRDRIKGHWYPESPERGQGYRAVVCEESTDKLLMDAAKKSDINGNFRTFFKQNTTMWIDPGNVTYRHGKHYEKTLYPFNSTNNIQYTSSSSVNNNSSSSNNLNNSFLMMLNNSSGVNAGGININISSSNNMNGSGGISMNGTLISSSSSTPNSNSSSGSITKSLLNSNSINYNPIYFNPNSTPPRQNSILVPSGSIPSPTNNSTPNNSGSATTAIKNSPSLSSSAPAFSPSSSVYHSLITQQQISQQQTNQITPPTSPLKDFTQNQQKISDFKNNISDSNINNSSVYSSSTRQTTIKPNYLS